MTTHLKGESFDLIMYVHIFTLRKIKKYLDPMRTSTVVHSHLRMCTAQKNPVLSKKKFFKYFFYFINYEFFIVDAMVFSKKNDPENMKKPQKLLTISPNFFVLDWLLKRSRIINLVRTTKSPLMQDWVFRLVGQHYRIVPITVNSV